MLRFHSAWLPPRAAWLLRLAAVLVALVALVPLGRLVADWVEVARLLGSSPEPLPPRGFDWVRWEDRDGEIVAAYVDRRGPAYDAGLREGAALFALEGQQFFAAADVTRVVERASGSTLSYEVVQDDEPATLAVPITRYPTFLYPLSAALWAASAWGFAAVAFVHLLALLVVAPLARRSRRGLRAAALIGAALLWVGGNLVRLLLVTAVGPPELASPALGAAFEGLTLASLAGWLLFPVLLLRHVLLDARSVREATRHVRPLLWFPPAVLGGAVAVATVRGSLGPLPPDALLAPILFYVCCYVATASGLILAAPAIRDGLDEGHPAPGWSRAGSAGVLVLALLGALFVLGALPGLTGERAVAGAALVVVLQLFSVAPVGLLTLATLRYGRFDRVLTRAMAYAVALGALFFALTAGLWALGAAGVDVEASPVLSALGLLLAVVVVERATVPLRRAAGGLFLTERQRARQRLNRFGDRVRTYLDAEQMAADAVRAVGEGLGARSAALFLQAMPGTPEARWIQAAYRPEPPRFTEAELGRIWEGIQAEGRVWAWRAELNESALPEGDAARLRAIGVALAVPVTSGRGEPVGLLVLGRRAGRRAVYNLEDVEMLKALAGQLALAVERLGLIEREKGLVRETAEAHLAALRAQINPHFLFNALNTIAALIAERPAEAEATVGHLAALFRHVLHADGRPFVPLADEARVVGRYLAIERARFGEKLRVEEMWDRAAADVPVPAFAVQTLVENAVKHGVERKKEGGRVRIASRRLDPGSGPGQALGAVEVVVSDTGAGIPALFAPGLPDGDGLRAAGPTSSGENDLPAFFGVGLRNVAVRLAQLYGRTDLLSFESTPGGGTTARLLIPASPPNSVGAERGAATTV